MMSMDRSADTWVLPSVIAYVDAPRPPADRVARAIVDRKLKALTRTARLDGIETRMVLYASSNAPRLDDVCPGLAWLVRRALLAPMPRLLYIEDLVDLGADRDAMLATLEDLFGADVAVRPCGGLLSATGRNLAAFRGASTAGPTKLPSPAIAPAPRHRVAKRSVRHPAAATPAPTASRGP